VDDIVGVDGTWRNFSGLIEARPRSVARPEGEPEIVDLLRSTEGPVRVVGAGHSCTALCATEGILVNLDRTAGIASTDIAARTAQIRGPMA
jgi:FAD/FMN-containing dehydrogenase